MPHSKDPSVKDPTIPLAAPEPSDLARAYADVALGYNRRLPDLEKKVARIDERTDHVHGIALSAHGMFATLVARVDEIALRVGAKRTISAGSMVAVTLPEPPLEIRTTTSKTGSHHVIDQEEFERLKAKFAEKEAEERGAKQALLDLQAQRTYEEAQRQARRNFWLFVLTIGGAVVGLIGWAIGHISASIH